MDGTTMYLEDVTINEKGKRHISIKSTGFGSMRVNVILAVIASGHNLSPAIIFKKKNPLQASHEQRYGCFIFYNEKAWVNQFLIEKWIDMLFPCVDFADGKGIIWDACRAHTANMVKSHLRTRGIRNIVIQGGMIPYLQAGDLGIVTRVSRIIWVHLLKVGSDQIVLKGV